MIIRSYIKTLFHIFNRVSQSQFHKFQGVVLTHKNLISTLKATMFLFVPNDGDSYISYLPLAHVFELLSTCTWILFGIKVGENKYLF